MKKIFALLLIALICLSCGKKEEDVIKIGAILPLTGSAAIWGQNVKKGIDLAVEEANENGGINGRKISLLYEDSQGLPKEAVTALQKLINRDKIQVVIGDVASSCVLSMAPIAEKNEVVLLSPGASNPDITNAGEYIFRNWHSDLAEGEFLAKYLFNTKKVNAVSVVYVNNGYGKGLEKIFKTTFENLGGKIETSESFEQGSTFFKSQISKLSSCKSNFVFLAGYPQEIPLLLRQAKEMGINKQFVCSSAFEDPQILKVAGNAAEEVIYDYPKQGDTAQLYVKQFHSNYLKKYNELPGALSDNGFDALNLIRFAIKNSGSSGKNIKEGLLNIKNYPGVAGNTSYDQNGDIIKEFVLKMVLF